MSAREYEGQSRGGLIFLLTCLLLVVLGFAVGFGIFRSFSLEMMKPASPPADPANILLQEGSGHGKPSFSGRAIPPWLFVHMGIIGALQILALIWAAARAGGRRLTRRDARMILFLCEVPMYLGLFGTLLGVCLTQFVTGSLVAPLAYCTTMSGVLLHLIGKIGIWLRLPDDLIEEA